MCCRELERAGVLLAYVVLYFDVIATDVAGVTVSIEGSVACPQDTVTFTCTVDRGVMLKWIAEPFFSDEHDQIAFIPSDLDMTRTVTSNGVTFHAVLTHADPVPGSPGFFTLQSTLNTTASATTNGRVIVCQEGISGVSENFTFWLQAPPPESSAVQYQVIFYGTTFLAGDIAWNSSMDTLADNFTITVSSLDGSTDLMTTVESSPLSNVILNYNTNYTIFIRGRNCGGSSTPAILQYMESGCYAPSEPVNGSVSGFTSVSVGSEVTYHCDTGLTLVGDNVAVCTSDRVWVPSGSEVMCLPPDGCDDPGNLNNGTVIFSSGTKDGSVITFQCDPGLSLVGDRVSQCRSGQWTVLPQDVLCTVPDTSSCECTEPTRTGQQEQFSTAAVAAMTGVPCIVVSLTVGALLEALLHHLITRVQSKPQSHSQTQKLVPMYENVENITSRGTESAEIELKSNEAYGPVRQQQISTTPNQAYGHVQL